MRHITKTERHRQRIMKASTKKQLLTYKQSSVRLTYLSSATLNYRRQKIGIFKTNTSNKNSISDITSLHKKED
jgi:hypothetical protein